MTHGEEAVPSGLGAPILDTQVQRQPAQRSLLCYFHSRETERNSMCI